SDSENWQILFDPTFVKYGLAVKYTSAALKLAAPPIVEPEITVGTMWEDYLIWKQPQLQPTTFQFKFNSTFTNALKGLVWDGKTKSFTGSQNSVWDLPLCPSVTDLILAHKMSADSKSNLFSSLSEAFTRLQSQGKTKLAVNPFAIVSTIAENKTDKYKSVVDTEGSVNYRWWDKEDTEKNLAERDRRAFTKDERDIIIKAFYESTRHGDRKAAPLIEFLFLTGCRPGEAFALEWKDLFMGKDGDYIRFSKSYNGQIKNVQVTKTGDIRIFKMYPKLRELLLRIKPATAQPNDLVFTNTRGDAYNSGCIGIVWNGKPETDKNGIRNENPGVVSRLVASTLISRYLSPYHARHTFITLMAQAGTDLFLLATACGNSVEVIQRHYLGVNENAQFPDI
ncbi:tyrosine-type recombinase/integrase, partial [Microcoleus sp. Aus8_D1]